MTEAADLVLIVSVSLYLAVGAVFLMKRWPVRAGLAMVAASLIPLTWQVTFTNSDAPGFAFPLLLMLPTALGIALAGLAWRVFRALEQHDLSIRKR